MSDTPRTDAAYFAKGATLYGLAGEMKKLERELADLKRERDEARVRVIGMLSRGLNRHLARKIKP